MRSLLNNIGGILFLLLFFAALIYLPDIINSITDRGFGETRQKIRSFLSTYGSQAQSRDVRGTSGKENKDQGWGQDCKKVERGESFSDFYIVPHSLSKSKNGREEPFDDFYASGKH